MCLASEFVSELNVSSDTLEIKLKDRFIIPIKLTDKVNNLIPQMWGRLHDCEYFHKHESYYELTRRIQACYDILVSNLIGVYVGDEFFVTDIYPVYYEEDDKIRYAVWFHDGEHISGVEIGNLVFDEVKDKIYAQLQKGGYFEKH